MFWLLTCAYPVVAFRRRGTLAVRRTVYNWRAAQLGSARVTGFAVTRRSVVLYAAFGIFSADFWHGTRARTLGVDARFPRTAIDAVRAFDAHAGHLKINVTQL